MNGLDDLRATLEQHAADAVRLDDTTARRRSVHQRVRVARRRRQAAGVGALAAVVAAVGVATVLPRDDSAAGPGPAATVFGVDVPRQLDSLGFTYEYREHVSGDQRARMQLEPSDQPRLVSWAGETGAVRVAGSALDDAVRGSSDDFTDWLLVRPGFEGDVTVSAAEGVVALAVYTVTGDRPDGTVVDGVTFRSTYAGGELLAAAVGAPGETTVGIEFAPTRSDVNVAAFCINGPESVESRLDLGPDGGYLGGSEPCGGRVLPVDPAGEVATTLNGSADPVSALTFTVSAGEAPLVDDDVRVVLAAWEGPAERRVSGFAVPTMVEHDGRLWRLERAAPLEFGPDGTALETPDDLAGGPVLGYLDWRGTEDATLLVDGPGDDQDTVIEGSGLVESRRLMAGEAIRLALRRGTLDERARGVGAFYVPAD